MSLVITYEDLIARLQNLTPEAKLCALREYLRNYPRSVIPKTEVQLLLATLFDVILEVDRRPSWNTERLLRQEASYLRDMTENNRTKGDTDHV
jgi:hypothetical protein